MSTPEIPEGLLGVNLGDLIPDLHGILPDFIADAIKDTVGVVLGPTGPNIGDPQPEGERPIPTTDPHELNAAVKAIDAVLAGIALIMKLKFIIPDKFEEPLNSLSGALRTIRGWLD